MVDHENLTTVRTAYDTVAEAYARVIPDTSVESLLDMAMVDEFSGHVRSTANRLVIDAGCGAGRRAATELRAELHSPDEVATRFTEQGFVVRAQLTRAPRAMENHPQAAILLGKPQP